MNPNNPTDPNQPTDPQPSQIGDPNASRNAQARAGDATATVPSGEPDPLSLYYGTSPGPGQPILLTPAQKAAMGGPQAEPKRVTMKALRDGSIQGEYMHAGQSFEVDEGLVDTLTLAGFAHREDFQQRAEQSRNQAKAAQDALKKHSKSTVVKPMGTRDASNPTGDPNAGQNR